VVVAFAGEPALPADAPPPTPPGSSTAAAPAPNSRLRPRAAGAWWWTPSSASACSAPSTAATPTGSPPSTPSPARAWPSTSPAASTPTPARLGPCFAASHTVSFIALKPGLLTLDGPDQCGELHLPRSTWTPKPRPAPGHEITPALFAGRLAPRARNSHKGSYGDAALIGAPGMVAAILAGRARAHLGAGRVLVGLLDPATLPVDILRPELMFRSAPELLAEAGIAAFAVGPGLGQSDAAWTLVHAAIALPAQLVLDADALNLVARDPGLQAALAHRSRPAVLTRTPPRRPACSAPPPPTCRPTASPPPAGWPGS
jgi:hypothetical protein